MLCPVAGTSKVLEVSIPFTFTEYLAEPAVSHFGSVIVSFSGTKMSVAFSPHTVHVPLASTTGFPSASSVHL